MIYDLTTQKLFTSSGALIKKLDCPFAGDSKFGSQFKKDYSKVICEECSKNVFCIDDKTDEEVQSLIVSNDFDAPCIFMTKAAKNIIYLHEEDENYNGGIIIKTLRSPNVIRSSQLSGNFVLLKDTGINYSYGDQELEIWVNNTNKEIVFLDGHMRRCGFPDLTDFKCYKEWFWVRSEEVFPVAAYEIPKDIKPGQRVFISDIIEDIPRQTHGSGNSFKLKSAYAIWTGIDLHLQIPEEFIVYG